jgi:hypothetical protein
LFINRQLSSPGSITQRALDPELSSGQSVVVAESIADDRGACTL